MILRHREIAVAACIALWCAGLVSGAAPSNQPVPANGPPLVRYDGARLVELSIKSPQQLEALEKSGALILNCIHAVGRQHVVATDSQLDQFRALGLTPRMILQDVQDQIDAERNRSETLAGADPFDDFFLDYRPYDGVGGIVWYLNELASRYPGLASMVDVGPTLEGRTIWGLRISNDAIPAKPGVVYFGCEHAREWIAGTIPSYFATRLLENYGIDPQVTELVDEVEFFLIPVLNVDGYIHTWTAERLWRKNRRDNGNGTFGVDINRNWAEGWGGPGSSGSGGAETYRGAAPFSEPETQALRDFFLDRPNIRAQLDIHSFSQLILWPFGYTSNLPADQPVYHEVGYAMRSDILSVHGRDYSAGPVYTAIYPASGVSVDWTYAQRGVFSFSFECRDTGQFGFELPADQIMPNNEELLPAMLRLSDSDWVRAKIRFAYPAGRPDHLFAGNDTPITVQVIPQGETPVPGTVKIHYRYHPDAAFAETMLAPLGGQLYEAVLPATNCTSAPEYYFSATGSLGSVQSSPRVAPDANPFTASVIGEYALLHEELLTVNPGWSVQGQWAYGQPAGGGSNGVDPAAGFTGPNVYGYNLLGNYANNLSARYLTTSAFDFTGQSGVLLEFRRWLGVESVSGFDDATVEVSIDGTAWSVVWSATDSGGSISDNAWQLQQIQLPSFTDGRPAVFLRWGMGPTDSAVTYPGWNIDDVRLYAAQCQTLLGDFNGDSEIDSADTDAFSDCYAASGGGVAPGCAIFDFDDDASLTCSDWAALASAWTGPGSPPGFAPCSGLAPAPLVDGVARNRYLAFTPGDTAGTPQAIRVTLVQSDLVPATLGAQAWVGPVSADGTASLQCTPFFDTWDAGTLLEVADQGVFPGATFAVEATTDGVVFSPAANAPTAPIWGDCVGMFNGAAWTPPNGVVNFNDIVATIHRFQQLPSAPPQSWVDVHDVAPNRVANFADVQLLVLAFQGNEYPYPPPAPCP